MMYQSFVTVALSSRPGEVIQHLLESLRQYSVYQPQIDSEEKYRSHHNYCRAKHFIPGGPGNLLHFRAHILVEHSAGLIPTFYFICRIHDLNLAGQEGLEPPACGFGDRRSTNWSYWPAIPVCLSKIISDVTSSPGEPCDSGTGDRTSSSPDVLYSFSCSSS